MASQSWGQLITDMPAVGTSYASFTTAQSLLSSGTALASPALITLPPGFFRVGGELDFDIGLSVGWASGQTWIFSIYVGGVAAAVSETFKTTTTGGTAEPWLVQVRLRTATVGNGTLATVYSFGSVTGRGVCPAGQTAAANYAAGMGQANWQEATAAAGTGFNSIQANTLDFYATSGTSAAANTIQVIRYRVVSWGNTAP